jgi:2,4-dienoyl-CoA reductase (NADPH2)
MAADPIFEPLRFRNLTVKNRIFRSNVSGRFDNYDGSGTPTRINWETKFARGGVGAILSSFCPVMLNGRIMPNAAMIDRDERIPFWRMVGEAVHRYDCKYILQLSHSGRQRDIHGVENMRTPAWSSSNNKDRVHGLLGQAMTVAQISVALLEASHLSPTFLIHTKRNTEASRHRGLSGCKSG